MKELLPLAYQTKLELLTKKSAIGTAIAITASGIVLGLSNPASAAVIWDWSYSGFDINVEGGSGMITTTDQRSDGSYLITSITGTSEGYTITSLREPGDNLLFSDFPQLGVYGFSYDTEGDFNSYNILFIPAQNPLDIDRYDLINLYNPSFYLDINFSATARGVVNPPSPVPEPSVPEPGSLIGFIALGSLMLGSAVRKAKN